MPRLLPVLLLAHLRLCGGASAEHAVQEGGLSRVVSGAADGGSTARRGDPGCFVFGISFEMCCLPRPDDNSWCWDGHFTAERCCGLTADGPPTGPYAAIQVLRSELFTGTDPYGLLDHPCGHPYKAQIDRYPDSHLTGDIVRAVVSAIGDAPPPLWLEVGSFLGNSAITTANALKALNASTGVLCMDPFTGMWGMWSNRKALREQMGLERAADSAQVSDGMLLLDEFGHSRIYEIFLANVRAAGHADIVMPLRIGSVSGMRLLRNLQADQRIQALPQVIYLDSAHEPNETLLEVREAWLTLQAPGVLLGDDWSWPGVRQDVHAFALEIGLPALPRGLVRHFDWKARAAEQPVPGLVVVDEGDGVWYLLKDVPLSRYSW